MPAASRRRVTRNCQNQVALPTDLVPTTSTPAVEPVTKRTQSKKKAYRTQRADDWAHTRVGDPWPCLICGKPALMRDPYTDHPCHQSCAKTQATERGDQW